MWMKGEFYGRVVKPTMLYGLNVLGGLRKNRAQDESSRDV